MGLSITTQKHVSTYIIIKAYSSSEIYNSPGGSRPHGSAAQTPADLPGLNLIAL